MGQGFNLDQPVHCSVHFCFYQLRKIQAHRANTLVGDDYSCVYFLTACNSLLTGPGETSNNQLLDAQNAAEKLSWLPITLKNRTKGDCRSSSCVLKLLSLRTMTPLKNSM